VVAATVVAVVESLTLSSSSSPPQAAATSPRLIIEAAANAPSAAGLAARRLIRVGHVVPPHCDRCHSDPKHDDRARASRAPMSRDGGGQRAITTAIARCVRRMARDHDAMRADRWFPAAPFTAARREPSSGT
jgi:hypothetical protein